jgi:dimeric dUTPase (all-alpha-NTP-PPase superfamily)
LGYSWVFTQTYQFLSCNQAYVCDSVDRLMMMTAHTLQFCSDNKHSLITVLTMIGETCCFRFWLVSSSHNLLKIHFGQSFCCLFAVWISLSINQQAIKNFFESKSGLKNELLLIFFCNILRNIIPSPKSFSLSFHSFSNDLRGGFLHLFYLINTYE